MRGCYIVVEGCDGTGKSTLVANLVGALLETGPAAATREPGGCPLGERLRAILKDVALAPHVPALSRRLLFEADRIAQQAQVNELLAAGITVVSDRCAVVSNHCYGAAEGASLRQMELLESIDEDRLMPDLVLLVDLPLEECRARLKVGADAQDPVERDPGMLARVHARYADLINQARHQAQVMTLSGFTLPAHVLDGRLQPGSLARQAYSRVGAWLRS